MGCDYENFETRYKGRLIALEIVWSHGPYETTVQVLEGNPMSKRELKDAVKTAKWVHINSWSTGGDHWQHHKSLRSRTCTNNSPAKNVHVLQ